MTNNKRKGKKKKMDNAGNNKKEGDQKEKEKLNPRQITR